MDKQEFLGELARYPDYHVTVGGAPVLGVELGTGCGGAAIDLVVDLGDVEGFDEDAWFDEVKRVPHEGLTHDEIGMIRHALGLDTPAGWQRMVECGEPYREHYVVSVKTPQHGAASHLELRGYLVTDNVVHNGMLTFRVTDKGKALFGIQSKDKPDAGENP